VCACVCVCVFVCVCVCLYKEHGRDLMGTPQRSRPSPRDERALSYQGGDGNKFSKVLYILNFLGMFTIALTFENLCQASLNAGLHSKKTSV